MTRFLFKDLTYKIIGAYFHVYNSLGHTYPEFVFEKAMRRDLERQGVACKRQEEYQILYKEYPVGLQRLDLFIAEEVIVELKVVTSLTLLHKAQIFSYLKAFDKRIGLLLNFGGPKPEFERLYYRPRQPQITQKTVEQTVSELSVNLISPELTYEIVGGLYTVHAILGPGFIHRIYANACYLELQERGLPVRPQQEMQVIYRGEPIASIKFAHLRVGDTALVFPVAVSDINDISFNNLKDWMRAEEIPLGILANFHSTTLEPIFLKV